MEDVGCVLQAHPALFGKVLENVGCFNLQVLVSEVRSGQNHLIRHGFRLGEAYFYPASAIKLCAAVAAMQKLEHLSRVFGKTFSCTTPLTFYPLFEGNDKESTDDSNLLHHKITVAHEIRKLFLVSDNRSFNRLYEFVGHQSLNQAMWDIGLHSTRIQHQLLSHSNSLSHPSTFCRPIGVELCEGVCATVPPKCSKLSLLESKIPLKIGTAYISSNNDLINEPMDFSSKNCMTLLDLQTLLIKITRNDIELNSASLLSLDESLRMMLMEAMVEYPGDSCNPQYDRNEYPDDYCKFFLPGLCRVRSKDSLRVYNKAGRAYGFTTDNAYIFDVETGRSFFLSATLYTNANGILNDDCYEYDIADRVLGDIGEVMARAIWQLPRTEFSLSTPLDCIPLPVQPTVKTEEPNKEQHRATEVIISTFKFFLDE